MTHSASVSLFVNTPHSYIPSDTSMGVTKSRAPHIPYTQAVLLIIIQQLLVECLGNYLFEYCKETAISLGNILAIYTCAS